MHPAKIRTGNAAASPPAGAAALRRLLITGSHCQGSGKRFQNPHPTAD
jgi:hypothetical protein